MKAGDLLVMTIKGEGDNGVPLYIVMRARKLWVLLEPLQVK
jgi:hypothetical protein